MRSRVNIIYGFVIFAFFSCGTKTPEFYETEGGLKYQYHDIVTEGVSPKFGDVLHVNLSYKTADDSVFYSSAMKANNEDVITLGKSPIPGGIEEGFAMLKVGDSVTFFISASKYYKNYLKRSVPSFLNDNEELKISLRLHSIEDQKTYLSRKENELAHAEIEHIRLMDSCRRSWGNSRFIEHQGVLILIDSSIVADSIGYGDVVEMKYLGRYMDGVVFYDNRNEPKGDEFQVGIPGQNIEGLRIALMKMKQFRKAKIIVPSELGFNQDLIDQGLIKPWQPLFFEIEIKK